MFNPMKNNTRCWSDPVKVCMLMLLLLLMPGCLELVDRLTINEDGSGTVFLKTSVDPQLQHVFLMRQHRAEYVSEDMYYPPASQQDANMLFSGDTKVEFSQSIESGRNVYITQVQFQNIQSLLNTPYAKARSLAMELDDNQQWQIQLRTGMQLLAHAEQIDAQQMGVLVDKQVLKEKLKHVRLSYALTLPGEGNEVTHDVDPSQVGADELSDYLAESTDKIMSLAVDQIVLNIEPPVSTTLDAKPFDAVTEGEQKSNENTVDVQAAKAAARFMPLALTVTRTYDYSGEFDNSDAGILLAGFIVVPQAYKPLRWGEAICTDARDDQDKSLILDADAYRQAGYRYHFDHQNDLYSDQKEILHFVHFLLKNPAPGSQRLAELKATVNAVYPGPSYLIRLPNVLSSERIIAVTDDVDSPETEEIPLSHPQFAAWNVEAWLDSVMQTKGMLMMELAVESPQVRILNAQIYDVKGNPAKTYIVETYDDEGESHYQIMVVGQPEPPLSLALNVDHGSSVVQFPISLKDLDFSPQSLPEAKKNLDQKSAD